MRRTADRILPETAHRTAYKTQVETQKFRESVTQGGAFPCPAGVSEKGAVCSEVFLTSWPGGFDGGSGGRLSEAV